MPFTATVCKSQMLFEVTSVRMSLATAMFAASLTILNETNESASALTILPKTEC